MELSVHKEIICKRQNHSFLFNKYTYHHRHLTKNGRQLELVPVLLFSLVDALLGEYLSKTDISSVPVPQVSVLSQNWPAGQWPDRPFWTWNRLFQEFLMKNDFRLRGCCLGFDWSSVIALIKSEILITTGMVWQVSSDKSKRPLRDLTVCVKSS